LHGSWEALIRSPVYANPPAPRAGEVGLIQIKEQRLALWEILVTLLVIFVRELVCDLLLGNYRGTGPITC